jgi:hypothetical protein
MKADRDDCVIAPHSNALKPILDEHHKFARVLYAIANLSLGTEEFHDYFDSVHVDEKWFFYRGAVVHAFGAWGGTTRKINLTQESHLEGDVPCCQH